MAPRLNLILWLLIAAIAINYIDRGAMSVAAPLLVKDLNIGPEKMGLLFSAFFWSYALCQLAAGWLVDRYDVKWVYAGGFALWSAATAAVGLVTGFPSLIAARLLLGVGESVAYPACSRLIVRNFPEERRGLVNALVDAGSKLGPAASTLFGGLVVDNWGWRPLFIGLGAASVLWLLPWVVLVPPQQSTAESRRAAIGYPELLRRGPVWVTSLGMFCLGYVWYFLLSWLPTYLVKERGLSMSTMAVFGSIPFLVMAAATTFGGWASDRWIRAGAPVTRVRKTFVVGGLASCGAVMLPAVLVSDPMVSIALISVACACLGMYTSNVWAITQTLAGPDAAGKWTGVQNAIGNFGGVLSPALTGLVVERTGSFLLAFFAAIAVLLIGALSYAILLGEIHPLRWQSAGGREETK